MLAQRCHYLGNGSHSPKQGYVELCGVLYDSAATSVKRLTLLALTLPQPFWIPGTPCKHCWLQIFKEKKEQVLNLSFFFSLSTFPSSFLIFPLFSFRQIFMLLWTWKSSPGLLAPAQDILFSQQVLCSDEQCSLSQQPFTSQQALFPLTHENMQGLCGESTGVFRSHNGCTFSMVRHKHWLKCWGILYAPLYRPHYTKRSLHFCQKAGHYCSLKT